MKKILFLLLLSVAMYGQVPADATPLENIQITNNKTSITATKVNVQENDGTINTKPLSELANYLEFASTINLPVTGEQGKLYLTKDNNRLYRFNGTIYQELTTDETTATIQAKRPLKTIENQSLEGSGNIDLSKSDVGLGNVDNTSDANKPISTATQTALNGKENSFTKNTAFNKNYGTTAGTVAQGNDSRILNGQTAFSWGNHASAGYALTTGSNINQSSFRTALGLGSNAYTSTAFLPLSGGDINGLLKITRDGYQLGIAGTDQGAVDLYKLGALGHRLFSDAGSFGIYDLENNVTVLSIAKATRAATFAGTISASPATTANQVVVKSQLDSFVPSGTVNLTGTQTVAGVKTFSDALIGTTANFSGTVTVPNPINPFNVATKQYVDNAASSGTYTPTFSNLVNVGTVSITNAVYTKVGNIIQGRCTASISAITIGLDTSFDFSLPQARNSQTNIFLCGNGARFHLNTIVNGITYIQSINTGRFIFKASGSIGSSDIVTFNFQYDITQ